MAWSRDKKDIVRALIARKADHALQFQPNEVQKAYLESEAHYRAINGSNQIGGKTYVACQELRMYYTQTHPTMDVPRGAKMLVLVPGRRQAADPWAKYLLKGKPDHRIFHNRYPMLPVDEHITKVNWDRTTAPPAPRLIRNLENDIEVWFWWTGYAGLAKMIQGMQIYQVFIDESAGRQDVLDELRPRLGEARETDSRAGRISWFATETEANPAYEKFLSDCRDEEKPDHQLFTVDESIFDRGSVMTRDTWENLYDGVDDEEKQIRLLGTGSRAAGLRVFPEFTERPDDFFLSEPYHPGEYDNIVVAWDPGMGHNGGMSVGFVGPDNPRHIHVKQAWFAHSRGPGWWASLLIDYLDGRKMLMFIPDKYQISKRDYGGANKSIKTQMMEFLDHPELWVEPHWSARMVYVDQHHDVGQLKVHTYLQPWPDLTTVKEPWITFDPPTPTNGMSEMRRQLVSYHGKGDPDHRGVYSVVKKDDEGPDLCRMMVMAEPRWVDKGLNVPKGIYNPDAYKASKPSDYEHISDQRIEEMRLMEASRKAAQRLVNKRRSRRRRRR